VCFGTLRAKDDGEGVVEAPQVIGDYEPVVTGASAVGAVVFAGAACIVPLAALLAVTVPSGLVALTCALTTSPSSAVCSV
jgi:hypothetical protein